MSKPAPFARDFEPLPQAQVMSLYIVHVHVHHDAVSEWEPYMHTHMEELLATGCFTQAILTRVPEADRDGTSGYRVLYHALDEAALERYLTHHAPALKRDHQERFEGRVEATREILPVLKHIRHT